MTLRRQHRSDVVNDVPCIKRAQDRFHDAEQLADVVDPEIFVFNSLFDALEKGLFLFKGLGDDGTFFYADCEEDAQCHEACRHDRSEPSICRKLIDAVTAVCFGSVERIGEQRKKDVDDSRSHRTEHQTERHDLCTFLHAGGQDLRNTGVSRGIQTREDAENIGEHRIRDDHHGVVFDADDLPDREEIDRQRDGHEEQIRAEFTPARIGIVEYPTYEWRS